MTTEFSNKTPSLKNILLYTWNSVRLRNRFNFSKRDILQSKIKVTNKMVYRPTKQKAGIAPDQMIQIESWSAPQYKPYINSKSKNRQMKVKHTYGIILVMQKDINGNYSYNSKIKWRVGSYKKWVTDVPQSKLKTVLAKTRLSLKKKYADNYTKYLEEIKKIRSRGIYLSIGDYNSQVNGLNGDNYYRDQYYQKLYDALYGPLWVKIPHTKEPEIKYPFACKHLISTIFFLLRKGVILKQ